MEALSRLLVREKRSNYVSGSKINDPLDDPVMFSHILFVHDTLIFCGADPEQNWHLKAIFVWF